MLSRIVLFLGFLLNKEIILRTKTRPRWVQAFSRIPTVTRVERWRNFGIESYQHPRTTAGTSSSLNAWQMPFGSTKKSPTIGKDGLYHIATEQEYRFLMEENRDTLVVLKVFSPWCKSCKALAPKIQALAKENVNLPITWISLAYSKENKHLVRSELGVNAVPYILLYAGDCELVDCFRCGPAKVATILRPKLADLITKHIDLSAGILKASEVKDKIQCLELQSPAQERDKESASTGPLKKLARRFFDTQQLDDSRPSNSTVTTSV